MQLGSIVVVYNGEIYNYRELREELKAEGQAFESASDTEVLARCYLHWGPRCVDRLRGMWAFAIADLRSGTLFCSRDPFGIKPFYFTRYRGAFLFASEPQALIRAGAPARANLEIASHYLALGVTDHDRRSFFADVQQLEPGASVLVSADGSLRRIAKWGAAEAAAGAATTAAEFDASLSESVRLHLRSDVPVGTCLSGGLDSSTVAALASGNLLAQGTRRFAAITAASGDPRTDERAYAGEVAAHCGLDWRVVTPESERFAKEIDECLRVQGEPVGGPSVYFQYCVMAAARAAGMKVMLDGQGADELLGGYDRYVPAWGLDVARAGHLGAAFGGMLRVARNSLAGPSGIAALTAYVLLPALRRKIVSSRAAFLRDEFMGCALDVATEIARSSRQLQTARVADLARFSLPALLRFEDRNSMAHSIEARVPYVDREVVRCALRLPERGLLRDGFTKYPLRQIAARILPASIAWRRFKIGFEPPTASWLARLSESMEREVASSTLVARLARVAPAFRSAPPLLRWRLYNLARWQRIFAVEAG